jgi:uncharacterized protein (DUF39 family)
VWQGTQHNPLTPRKENGVPQAPAGSLAVMGDLKGMQSEWLSGTTMYGYGTTLSVGIGIPIPILNEEICQSTAVKDEEIWTQIVDYSEAYPQGIKGSLGEANYAQLRKGKITVEGKEVPTGGISSYFKAKKIATLLKERITHGDFLLTEPVASLPDSESGYAFRPMNERPIEG